MGWPDAQTETCGTIKKCLRRLSPGSVRERLCVSTVTRDEVERRACGRRASAYRSRCSSSASSRRSSSSLPVMCSASPAYSVRAGACPGSAPTVVLAIASTHVPLIWLAVGAVNLVVDHRAAQRLGCRGSDLRVGVSHAVEDVNGVPGASQKLARVGLLAVGDVMAVAVSDSRKQRSGGTNLVCVVAGEPLVQDEQRRIGIAVEMPVLAGSACDLLRGTEGVIAHSANSRTRSQRPLRAPAGRSPLTNSPRARLVVITGNDHRPSIARLDHLRRAELLAAVRAATASPNDKTTWRLTDRGRRSRRVRRTPAQQFRTVLASCYVQFSSTCLTSFSSTCFLTTPS